LYIIQEIQCDQLKDSIFESLAYLNDGQVKEHIKKDAIGTNYSKALYEILKEVNRLLKSQNSKNNVKDKN